MIDTTKAIQTLQAVNAGKEVANAPTILRINSRAERVNNKSGSGYRMILHIEGVRYPVTVWDRDVPAFRTACQLADKDATGAILLPVRITATTSDDWYNVTAKPLALVTDASEVFG